MSGKSRSNFLTIPRPMPLFAPVTKIFFMIDCNVLLQSAGQNVLHPVLYCRVIYHQNVLNVHRYLDTDIRNYVGGKEYVHTYLSFCSFPLPLGYGHMAYGTTNIFCGSSHHRTYKYIISAEDTALMTARDSFNFFHFLN